MTRPVDAVIEFLEAEQARGVTHVLLDEGARDGMRDLLFRARAAKNPPPAAAVPAPAKLEPPTPAATPAAPPASVSPAGDTNEDRLASLRKQAESWAPAKALGTLRDILVFATGLQLIFGFDFAAWFTHA